MTTQRLSIGEEINSDRRRVLRAGVAGAAALAWPGIVRPAVAMWHQDAPGRQLFDISLAQWSLHRELSDGKLDNLEFAAIARERYDITAVEYVNSFFGGKGEDTAYLDELRDRAEEAGVRQLLIMVDGEGALGDADAQRRAEAVRRHHKWVAAARHLGATTIRVNAQSSGSYEEQTTRAANGLRQLAKYAAEHDINVIVENHGGLSSNGAWLAGVLEQVGLPNCGSLPDFGNFRLGGGKEYDRYQGVTELMPFAKAVSAKSYDFDDEGNETTIDYVRMLKIVTDAGYQGHVGIEYEGERLSEDEGILATKVLLERVRAELQAKRMKDLR